jgi:hypothetical protein
VNPICLLVLGGRTLNWIGVSPIFARPNKVQLSVGAFKVKLVPGGRSAAFGLSAGSFTDAVQVASAPAEIIALTTCLEAVRSALCFVVALLYIDVCYLFQSMMLLPRAPPLILNISLTWNNTP